MRPVKETGSNRDRLGVIGVYSRGSKECFVDGNSGILLKVY